MRSLISLLVPARGLYQLRVGRFRGHPAANGLLEPGEGLRTRAIGAMASRCAVTCSKKTRLPDDRLRMRRPTVQWSRNPGGGGSRLRTPPATFQAAELRVTDVDHDGLGDAMGPVTPPRSVIRHGEATGQLGHARTRSSRPNPDRSSRARRFSMATDRSILTLTTIDGHGLVRGRTYGELAPIAVNSALLDGGNGQPLDFRRFLPTSRRSGAGRVFVVDPMTNTVVIIVLD